MTLSVRHLFATVALVVLVTASARAQEPLTISGSVTSDAGLTLGPSRPWASARSAGTTVAT